MQARNKMWVGGVVLVLLALGIFATVTLQHGFSARDTPTAMERIAAQAARGIAVPSKAKQRKDPVPYSDAVLQEARMHWADHCATCHANNGSGDTEIGRNLYPKTPDMRQAETQSMSDGELYYIIKNGVRLSGMPAWGQPGDDDEDSWKLVHFIRHLPQMTAQEAEEMKAMNPQSPMEKMEEKEEDQFLQGGAPPSHSEMQPKKRERRDETHIGIDYPGVAQRHPAVCSRQ